MNRAAGRVRSPDVPDQRVLPLQPLQEVGEAPPHADGVPLQVLLGEHVQDGESDGARHRVAAELRDLDQRRGG